MADALKVPKRLPKDFNIKHPDLEITDPDGADLIAQGKPIDRVYPKHLARFADALGGAREIVEVHSAAEERNYKAQGYKSHQELDVDARHGGAVLTLAAKPIAARKPRNPKPKAPVAPVN